MAVRIGRRGPVAVALVALLAAPERAAEDEVRRIAHIALLTSYQEGSS